MNKQNLIMVGAHIVKAAKVSAIVVVVTLTLVGAYVVANGEVRNLVIDHAQGQNQVAGLE